jgi:DNA mismatch repair protein mutS
MRLNLETESKEQELVKAYLEENASETLAEKINNGTPFEKDEKTLINKKTLDGFMKYASDEARKLASKGANSACVEDKVVYGWAVHYFEEESIEGTLYNEDGTEYKPAPKPTPAQVRKVEPKKPEQRQPSLFDFMEPEASEPEVNDENGDDEDEQPSQEEIDEILAEIAEEEKADTQPEKPVSPIWQKYQELQKEHSDRILLYRLGDFYEVFGDNAVTLSDELGLTLTGRDFGLTSRVPMIGFPYHAADNYLQKIIQKHKVAIAETPDDVKLLTEPEDDFDELTEEEMREFDGDIEEPQNLDDEPEDGFDASAFDKTAVVALVEIFGDKLSVR